MYRCIVQFDYCVNCTIFALDFCLYCCYILYGGIAHSPGGRTAVHGVGRPTQIPPIQIGHDPATKRVQSYRVRPGLLITMWTMLIIGGMLMDWQVLIGQYAFPIVCCIALFISQEKERERHKEECDKWVEALNNNTRVIEALNERLKHEN